MESIFVGIPEGFFPDPARKIPPGRVSKNSAFSGIKFCLYNEQFLTKYCIFAEKFE
jgi:hypothetical protein